jgi:mRNA interferase MazF
MRYVPERGDIVWINLNPQAGHEQAGHRPALVLSPKAYNAKVGLMLCCPITHQAKGYPFEVDIRGDSHVSGVVLSDQVKCLDWQARGIRKKGVATRAELEETLEKLKTLLE